MIICPFSGFLSFHPDLYYDSSYVGGAEGSRGAKVGRGTEGGEEAGSGGAEAGKKASTGGEGGGAGGPRQPAKEGRGPHLPAKEAGGFRLPAQKAGGPCLPTKEGKGPGAGQCRGTSGHLLRSSS